MIESNTKQETLARAAIVVAIALAWCFFAYVMFVSAESNVSVLSSTDLDLSKPAAAVAIYERIRSAAGFCTDGRSWLLRLSASRLVRRLRAGGLGRL
jgi:UrcA family protein